MRTVVFASVHDAGRSQMAAGFFNALADPERARAISAGTQPDASVHPLVVIAMREVGIDLSAARPQRLTPELVAGAVLVVTMGCGEDCPYVPGVRRDDWRVPDLKGQTIAAVREIRDEIRARVAKLLAEESAGPLRHAARADTRAADSREPGPVLSVVVPVFNEAAGLAEFQRRLAAVLDALHLPAEIVYVNDGSRDGSLELLHALRDADARVGIVNLSRNFGKEIAVTAGLDHAAGQAVVLIDADLQDPPELIPELYLHWVQGYDVVYAQRTRRDGETWLKKGTAHAFYYAMRRVGAVELPAQAGDFRLLSRRAVDALGKLRERHRFMKGLFTWIGYRQIAVPYNRDARFAGETKWSYSKLWHLAVEGLTCFTVAPLTLASYLGLLTAGGAFLYGSLIILGTLWHGRDVPGYPSLMVVTLFLGGVQLMALGVLGEYVGRTFNEVKQRPLYFAQDFLPPKPDIGSRQPGERGAGR